MSAWSCPQPGEILCTDDAVRMPVGSVLERLADDNGWKRYRVLSTPAELARLRAAARRVSAQWESMHHCYQSTDESVELADLLDDLAQAGEQG